MIPFGFFSAEAADNIIIHKINKRSKKYTLSDGPKKKAKLEDIDRAHRKIHEDHDKIGAASGSRNGADLVQHLLDAAGDAHAWDDKNAHAGRVQDFKSDSEQEEAENDVEDGGGR